jgi:hypothetical protein
MIKKNNVDGKIKCWLMFSLSFMCLMLGNMHSPSVKTLQNKQHKTNNELQEKIKNDKKWKLKTQVTNLK